MKKEYCKPTISFESFKMSSSIAGTCTLDGTLSDEHTCEFDTGIGNIFVTGCDFTSKDGKDFNVCLHVPMDDKGVFAS